LLPRLALGFDPDQSLHKWCQRVLPALRVATTLAGTPDPSAPLWVSNHLSWVDPLILMGLRPMGTLAKGEVASYPLLGRWAQRAGLHFVRRDQADSRAAALVALARELHKGRPMLLFPEGTTTRGEGLAPLHSGGLRAAWELNVPTQTFRLSSPTPHYPWTGDETLLPHISMLFAHGAWVRVEAGPTLRPRDFPNSEAWVQAIRCALSFSGVNP
jgi:1-acyl-sn-glycerol-3-phosphate acyltransferase